ncbi:CGNR zinc finger domain-containing protein [Microbacterium sp. NPDC076911]|uniref:CGNR zinc finger domain-containing protein n=1 Tax=Microbacterium sp. NPDC076911 TaxID=3154958 RepID=UPI003414C119
MVFIHDTKRTLMMAVDLANTLPGYDSDDTFTTTNDLELFLKRHPYTGHIEYTRKTVDSIRDVRSRLRALWNTDRDGGVELINQMLADGDALPRLVRHEGYDWHIHATSDSAPLAMRMLVESAMAFVDVIRSDEYSRVRVCEADDCDAVYIDYSKNQSKRYCDTGNCGNRMNVIAYRARKAQESA